MPEIAIMRFMKTVVVHALRFLEGTVALVT